MQGFGPGTRISTQFRRELRIIKPIGGGGQGTVYQVDCNGKPMALKWYKQDIFRTPEEKARFEANLRRNILQESPSPEFLWPIDMTVEVDGTFGYLMELAPKDYISAKRIIRQPGLVPSFRRCVDACLNIVMAFCKLHDKGYSYQDINDGNFFVNPSTGKVLICDNENVAPGGQATGVLGTPYFMAPEIVTGASMPTQESDLHSMAVMIFYLLLVQHPLLGIRSMRMDDANKMRLFGTQPLFIFDPVDHSNAAIQSPMNNALKLWPMLPSHMRELFTKAFSREALMRPSRRVIELRWMQELAQFRSEIVDHSCGNEVFLDGAHAARCVNCGKWCNPALRMEVGGKQISVVNDARLYTCQIRRASNTAEALDPQLWALASSRDPSDVILRNVSRRPWQVHFCGHAREVGPGQNVRATDGLEIGILGETVRVCRNVG